MAPPRREPSVRSRSREALLAWFRTNGPDYPWRRTERDPYAVLVSEVMLQQTQASRVVEAFPRFLERFPDLRALADASVADVLGLWSGLGYHRRAVALRDATRIIVRDHGAEVPGDVVALRALPGVGPYTAAAVSSIAFGTPVAAVDTNVRRVMARMALGAEPEETRDGEITDAAQRWVAPDAPGDWNQAVMNLGREVCRPSPRCDVCPLAPACRFRPSERAGRRSVRRQPAFAGSMRQLRGAILRELLARGLTTAAGTLAGTLGESVERVSLALSALEEDGLVERTHAGRCRLSRH